MDKELEAIGQIISALESLDIEEKKRVLDYIFTRLGLKASQVFANSQISSQQTNPSQESAADMLGSTKEQPTIIPRPSNEAIIDIRLLKEQKQPATAIQMATLVAYYLSELAPEADRKTTVNSDDITKYFKQADFPLPTGPAFYTLRNARNAGYFDPAGETGVYKLNPVGYNLVAHKLPMGNISSKTGKAKAKKLKPTPTQKSKKRKM